MPSLADGERERGFTSFLFRRKERTKEKSRSAESFRRGKEILTLVRQRLFCIVQNVRFRQMKSMFCAKDNPSVAFGASSLYTREPCVCARTFYFASFKNFLSDGKDNNEQCTRVSLPCVKGGGPRSGGRIVSGHNVTFCPLSKGKTKNEWHPLCRGCLNRYWILTTKSRR